MLYAIFAVLGAALLALDQWVKHWITVNLPLGESAPLLPGLVELRTVHNYGAAWSSFSGQRWLLLAVTACIVLAVLYALVRRIVRHPLGLAACFLILSGGIGNIIDRARLGYVVELGVLPRVQRGGHVHRLRMCPGRRLVPVVLRKIRQKGCREWNF